MNKKSLSSVTPFQLLKGCVLSIIFLLAAGALFLIFQEDEYTTSAQKWGYSIGTAGLLAALGTLFLGIVTKEPSAAPSAPRPAWFYPLMAGILGFLTMSLAYSYLGMYPVGDRTGMVVDMHHQYAPLLAQLREMLLHGGNPLYTFHVGLGSSFLPLFGYYLSSPFNLLLVFFPQDYLTEGILLITLLKNALTAAAFAACVQYVYRRRDMSVCIMAIMYSMMMYLIAYSWNIMWLDCVMVLPIIILGFERLMRTGRYTVYVLSLAYALFANYYIGFMLCLFMVLYYLVYVFRRKRSADKQGRGFVRFAIGSLIAGGLSMFLLLPVALSLGQTSAAGGSLADIKANFDMFDLLGRHLYGTSPTIRSGNLPNIYCGILAVFFVPIFATLKTIPLRRRLSYMGLFVVMGFSQVINQMDLIWHGLHAPNDLPYRFSFLYSFVLLLIAYETLTHLRDIQPKQIVLTAVGVLAYIMLEERFGSVEEQLEESATYGFNSIYISLLLVLIYAVVTALASSRRLKRHPAYALLLLIVVAEMTFNGGDTFRTLNANEYFTAHADYVDNSTTRSIREAVAQMKAYGDEQANGTFYRMEKLPRRTTVDPALFDYRGLSVFASSNSYKTTKFMGSLGYAINGVNSYLYQSFVAPTDSLFGIKYVALPEGEAGISDAFLKKVKTVETESETYGIYENTAALPIGYFVQSSVRNWSSDSWSPFTSQSSLFTSMTGDQEAIYDFEEVTVSPESENIASIRGMYGISIDPEGASSSANFDVPITQDGTYYVFVDCSAAESISVNVRSHTGGAKTVSPNEAYILNAGALEAGDEVNVTIGANSSVIGNIYVARLNEEAFSRHIQILSANGLNVTDFSDSHITGTLSAPEDGTVFLSIPYDRGWTVKVNGQKVDTYGIGQRNITSEEGAMLAFDIAKGENYTVELSFFPRGLLAGIIISAVSLAAFILLLIYTRHRPASPAAVKATPDGPHAEPAIRLTIPNEPAASGAETGEAWPAPAVPPEEPGQPPEIPPEVNE